MKYVSVADIHLGKRAQGRVVDGRNQRELDIEAAWTRAVQVVVDEQPDLVTIAGDVYDSVRPSMHAVRAFQVGITRIVRETKAHVVIIPGNHCMPRTVETLTPSIVVDGMDRVHLVTTGRAVRVKAASTGEVISVACVPFAVMQEEQLYDFSKDATGDRNVLLIHAAVRTSAVDGALSPMYAGPECLDVGALADEWDVIACGDYHDFVALHPSRAAFYSGSIERVSSDIWKETGPKGVVVGDTDSGSFRLVEIPTRPMHDYEYHDFGTYAEPVNALALNDALRELATSDELANSLVRLKVGDFPRSERDLIDWTRLRELRERCVHFRLDLRFRERELVELGDRRERTHRSLAEEAAAWFADDDLPVRTAAFGYLGFDLPQEVAHA